MDATIVGIVAVVALAAAGFTAAFVVWSVVPLLAQLRKMSVQAELVLARIHTELPPLLKQTTQTLRNLDGTLAENLPALVSRTTGTLQALDGSLTAELPSLIRETTQTVRHMSATRAAP